MTISPNRDLMHLYCYSLCPECPRSSLERGTSWWLKAAVVAGQAALTLGLAKMHIEPPTGWRALQNASSWPDSSSEKETLDLAAGCLGKALHELNMARVSMR